MKTLYKMRGIILGVFALALLLVPPGGGMRSVSGYLLIAVGAALRVSARTVIGDHSRGNTLDAPSLVTAGVYSRVRHPLYLSNLLIGSGFALVQLGWQALTFAFVSGLFLFVFLLASEEDRFLSERFGAEFEKWRADTPAFFPGARTKTAFVKKTGCISVKKYFTAFIADRWTWTWLLFYSLLLVLRNKGVG